MAKNINNKKFTQSTQLKLDIFRDCFREWLPVFLRNPAISNIFIYDLFAGSGTDIDGSPGSPLLLLEESIGENKQHCDFLKQTNNKKIIFAFNDIQITKSQTLHQNIEDFLTKCKIRNKCDFCLHETNYYIKSMDFQQLFQNEILKSNLMNQLFGKYIILDQYGFKQIDNDIFIQLTNAPKTDFIFFISSSTIRRFQNSDVVKNYLESPDIIFDNKKPKDCHRVIANYFKSLIPKDKEYYLHHFTILKKPNYYGLIFGSNHSFGMEKFLKVCWKHDPLAGESNCNIDDDFENGTLFHDPQNSNKKQNFKINVEKLILRRVIKDNVSGMKYALNCGCFPSLFIEVIDSLLSQKKISIDVQMNRQATGIHKVKKYQIKVL